MYGGVKYSSITRALADWVEEWVIDLENFPTYTVGKIAYCKFVAIISKMH